MVQILESFGGIGSPRIALRNLGIPTKAIDYIEIDQKAVNSYNAMFADELAYKPQTVVNWNLRPKVAIHGSPCQDNSVIGGKAGMEINSGTRSSLLWESVNSYEQMGAWRPENVIWENVPGVLRLKKSKGAFKKYLEKMESLGYTNSGAFYLDVKEEKTVLLIDIDESMNLTKRFRNYITLPVNEKSTVKEFFNPNGGNPEPIKITERIDLIAGYSELKELSKDVEKGKGRGYLLSWYYANIEEIESKYDYILIDTHNDFSIFTDNAIAVSDVVIAIADIDEDAIEKLQEEHDHIEELKKVFVNPMNDQSFVNAQLIKIGNKVQSNTSDSHKFKEAFEHMMSVDPNFLGYFEFRTLFAKAKTTRSPLVELEPLNTSKSHKAFFKKTWDLYQKIYSFGEEV